MVRATPAPPQPQPVPLLPPQGALVPQMRYDVRANNRGGFHPEPPIVFAVGDQSGIPLQDAIDGRFEGLVGRDEEMFVGCGCNSISLRIQVQISVPLPLIDFWTKGLLTILFASPHSGPGISPGVAVYVHHQPGKIHTILNSFAG